MARKPSNNQTEQHIVTDAETPGLDAANEAKNTLSIRSAQIAEQYGEGLPYERERIVHETRFFMNASAEAMLEVGKRLIQIKENEPHGDFESIVRERIGIPERTAQRMMAAALKFMSPQLANKKEKLIALGKSKLFELMSEDDEQIAALADGGTVAGLTLDDIDGMTNSELRAALRESRGDVEAKERLLSDKNSKIDSLSTKLKRVDKRLKEVTPDQESEALIKETSLVAFDIQARIINTGGGLRAAFAKLSENTNTSDIDHEAFMAGCCAQIERSLIQVRDEFNIKAAPEADPTPEWMGNEWADKKEPATEEA